MLVSPYLLSELSDVRVDDFLAPAHRDVLEAMRAVEAVDVITVAEEMKRQGTHGRLPNGEGYLLTLTAQASDLMFPHHLAIVVEKALARRLIAACSEALSRAFSGHLVTEIVADHRVALASLELDGKSGGPVSLADSVDAALALIEKKCVTPENYRLGTGLRDFDAEIGGMRDGQLVVVAGRPGKGKTAFAQGVALHHGGNQVPVLIFSLEMKRQELIERALSAESGIDGRRIVAASLKLADWEALKPAGDRLIASQVWIDDRKLTTARICLEAMRWREMTRRMRIKAGAGEDDRALVVIDYLGLVRSDMRAENRNLEVAAMSAAFKGLAGDLNAPVMLLAQLSRASERDKREPMLSDLRDSGAIEADADMVIFPWRDDSVLDVTSDSVDASIIVGKHRNGPIGKIAVRFRPKTTQFLDIDTWGQR